MHKSTDAIRGQATTEYILLISFIIAILVGVSGILTRQVEDMGAYIETRASEVMSQRQIGIPLNWFLSSAGNSGANGDNGDIGNGDNNADPNAGLAPDGAGDNQDGDGGGGGPNAANTPDAVNAAGDGLGDDNVPGDDGGGAGAAGSGDQFAAGEKGGANRASNDAETVYTGGTSSGEVSDDAQKPEAQKSEEEGDGKSAAPPPGSTRREFALTNEEDRRASSCEDFDFFRFLKIIAIIVLVLIGGAYMFTGMGNRGGRKK